MSEVSDTIEKASPDFEKSKTVDLMEKLFGSKHKRTEQPSNEEKTNTLITGIGGFVGSHLADTLKSRNSNVVGILRDLVPSDWINSALSRCTVVQGDVRNKEFVRRVIDHYEINQVYHVAASAIVKHAHKNPYEVFDTNVMGTVSVLDACRETGKFTEDSGSIVVLNTDKVYGEITEAAETYPYMPSEPYATSKCCQGFVAGTYKLTYNMNVKSIHSCNIFGYDPFNNRIIPNTVKACVNERSPIIYTNDESKREYVFIDDLVDALYYVTSDNYDKPTYNVGTGWIYNQKDIVLKILEYYNDINFTSIEPKYIEGKNIPFQIQEESLKSENWNWTPKWTFDDAIQETVDRFLIYKYDYI